MSKGRKKNDKADRCTRMYEECSALILLFFVESVDLLLFSIRLEERILPLVYPRMTPELRQRDPPLWVDLEDFSHDICESTPSSASFMSKGSKDQKEKEASKR